MIILEAYAVLMSVVIPIAVSAMIASARAEKIAPSPKSN